jgi:hypothetical protein
LDEGSCPFHDEGDVGPIVRVNRGIVGDPDQLRASRSLLPVAREAERAGRELATHEVGEARLVDGELALRQTYDDSLVLVERDDAMAGCGDTRRRDDAEVPETGDAYSHGRPSTAE